jgi:outer membrane protein OmpA-like peptidoglycan-associated protein
MNKSSLIVKLLCISLFFAAVNAFANNLNIYGQAGIHKTQSAKTLGHGRFGLGFFVEGAGLNNIIQNERFSYTCSENSEGCSFGMSNYVGGNVYPFLSLGLSDYFDFGISLPIYGDYLRVDYPDDDNLSAGGWGDLLISSKVRVPFEDDFPLNLALVLGFSIATGKQDLREVRGYGPWVRSPAYLNVNSDYPLLQGENTSPYTNLNSAGKVGLAVTFDFEKMRNKIPLQFHLNWGYRMMLGESGNDYPGVQNMAVALELTPAEFITLFTEFYADIPSKSPKLSEEFSFADLSTATAGISFHLSKKVDIQLGAQFLLGDDSKYVNNLAINLADSKYATYNARLIPNIMAFGGLTVQLFVIEEEWEEEYRNPDTDGDGICDPWVRETGRQQEFSRVCTGLDLCPYEEGSLENRGCPQEEAVEAAPPTVVFSVNPETVAEGQYVTLKWITTNATDVSIEGIGSVSLPQGSKRVRPTETTTYTITVTGPGGTRTESVEVTVEAAAGPSVIFNSSQESIQPGQTVTLSWIVTDATEVSIEGVGIVPPGVVLPKDSKKVKPTETTTYTITAKGLGGITTETLEVVVETPPVPTIIFTASAETIQKGQNVTLNWVVNNATEVSIEGIGKVPAQFSRKLKPTETTTYTLTATGPGGTQMAMVDVEVEEIAKKVNLKGVNFLSGKAELTLDARRVLDDVAEQLLASPEVKIEIHGHTDNQGTAKANQDLSERRAKAVVSYLARKGVGANRMRAVGLGQDVPIADNKTADGRELNRRIEMIRMD